MSNLRKSLPLNVAAVLAAMLMAPPLLLAQQADSSADAKASASADKKLPSSKEVSSADSEEVLMLSPFEVRESGKNDGYVTTTTLAGNRLNADLKDLGTSLSVYNTKFMKDIGATDNASLLKYTLGTEIGGINGNFSGSGGGTSPNKDASYLNPQSNNRVRGLVGADNTRDLYLSSIPWDGYNVDAVDLQRGPNAILFGQGSPGGVINARTKQASFRDSNEISIRNDQYGSKRGSVDFNKVIIKDELALRFDAVSNQTKFRQKPAFETYDREYVAVRYEPKFLKFENARTIIKADAEFGSSNSNRPRNMPPEDRITPWFTALNKQTYNSAWVNDGNFDIPGHGAAVKTNWQNKVNPNFEPWIGGNGTNYGNNYYGGAEFFYNPGSSTPVLSLVINPNTYLGVDSTGTRDGSIGGLANSQPRGVAGYRDWAQTTNQPFSSLTKNKSITDTHIFDYYNNLLDGEIKREWGNFKTYDASLSQTFLRDSIGFDVGYHKESVINGNYSPLMGDGGAIFIDVNSRWADGTNTPATGYYNDGTVNTGAGKPFLQLGNGRGETESTRQTVRATAFVTHNFANDFKGSWMTRLLGEHTVTGMASKDTWNQYSHSWVNSTFTGDYTNNTMFDALKKSNSRFWADFVPIRTVYIGDSLVTKKLGDNFNIKGPSVDPQLADTVNLRYFDSHWNAPGVSPSADWYNQVTAAGTGAVLSTQSENPANYVGWVNKPVQLLRATNGQNRELLTTNRQWDDRANKARAFVWQGKFWDDSVIATAGVRHDNVSQVVNKWDSDSVKTFDMTQIPTVTTENGPYSRNSRSWGVVAHLNRLPGLAALTRKLPVNISLSYNRSSNFETGQVFKDYFGQSLPLPEGQTKDMGILIATKDNRFSLKVNKFHSKVTNNISNGLQFWNYGNNIGIFAQAWSQFKYNYENRGDPKSTRHGASIVSDLPAPTDAAPNNRWNFDYMALNGQTQQQAEQQEVAVINAWDQWMKEMSPLPQTMGKAWGFNWDDDLTEQGIDFRFTEDLVAKGYETELNAQVTKNWRLTLNASRIESIRDNIGGTMAPGGKMRVIDYLLDFDRRIRDTAMGDLRIWGGSSSATARENWMGYADGDLKARLAEQGTVVPENRLWHINLISNYDFDHGLLNGWSIGGAVRREDASTLAYTPIQHANYISYDLNKPYRDKALIDFDGWVGYGRRLFKNKVGWRVQLNVSNIGVGNKLIPVTVQPDGSPASYRIRPPQQWFITNTFTF